MFCFKTKILYNCGILKKRYITPHAVGDLKDRMGFVGGPIQVVKTRFCRNFIAASFGNHVSFNEDNKTDRKAIILSSLAG